jgi:hypothetical protein
VDFWFLFFFISFMLWRTAHVAARLAAVLAKGAVRAGVLLLRLLIHNDILHSFTNQYFFKCPGIFCFYLQADMF